MINDYWILLAGAALVLVLVGVLVTLVWRRRTADLGGLVRAVALDCEQNVVVPNGMGGMIQIEYLLLTAHGVVVVDLKQFEGTIFGSDRMDEWTVMGMQRRFTFANPQRTLYDRVAAIRRLVRDIPVVGHVVFANGANFSKGRPREVMLADEFAEHYRKPEKAELDRIRSDFEPHWERIKAALQSV